MAADPDHGASTRTSSPAPLTSRMLDVGDGHSLYVESNGREDGTPAVYLHGGPGSGCQPDHRRLFDAQTFHAVLFDQRGAGRSTPKGSRDANTLQHLVADLETIREHFGFAKWLVVGGSWGATLALAYAQAHPERVSGLVLRATFLGTRAEIERAFCDALPRHYPDLNEDFLSLLPIEERATPLDAYWKRILDADRSIHAPAARAWNDAERALSEIKPGRTRVDREGLHSDRPLSVTPFIEAHYFRNDCFLEPDQLLRDAPRLAGLPGIIVQGRYDLLCPPQTSHALAQVWREAEIRIVESAGHSLYDPGVRDAVKTAIDELGKRLG